MYYSVFEIIIVYTPDAGPRGVSIFDTLACHVEVSPRGTPYLD
jgi:hypothetical protein